jgi:hypothetical protein
MVVGRRVLGAFVTSLCAGSGMENAPAVEDATEVDWETLGKEAFQDDDVRLDVVKGVLVQDGMGGWCEEQVGDQLYDCRLTLDYDTSPSLRPPPHSG